MARAHTAVGAAATTRAQHQPTLPRWLARSGAAVIVLLYIVLLGVYPLGDPDEARYAEISREMLELHDWVTPRLNYVKYFEKPPLLYWLNAINFALFGMSNLVARLWIAWFALAGIGIAYALGREIYGPRTGCLAAALLAAAPLYFGLGQFLTLDMALSGCLTAGLASFWFAYTGDTARRFYVLASYLMIALAVLIKGPVAVVLSAGIIVAFLLARWDLGALRWVISPLGLCVFAGIVAPWFIAVSLRNPEFLHFFFIDQHVDRYLSPSEHREPIWYYVPVLLGGMLPWSAFVLLAPLRAIDGIRRVVSRRRTAGTTYLVAWCGVVFLFFSLSGSKVGTYVLPLCCPLAILTARFLEPVLDGERHDMFRRGVGFVMLVGAVALLWGLATPLVVDEWRLTTIASCAALGGGALLMAAVAASVLARRRAPLAAMVTLWIGVLFLQLAAISGRVVGNSYELLGETIRATARAEDSVVGYRHYTQGTTYYGQRRVVQVSGHGELEFGRTIGDQRRFFWDSDDELLRRWASGSRMFLIIDRRELEPLRTALHPPPREVAGEGRKVLVVNFTDHDSRG